MSAGRMLRCLAGVVAGALLLTGCQFDVYKLPLPGGTDTGDDPITVTAEFRDVLDLVPKSTVKVADVNVGKVTDVELEGEHAKVTMELNNDVDLPANTVAQIRQTSLLGEKFVSLSPPQGTAEQGHLADGANIPLDRTGRNPEVEEVLGALSLLLNGGGVAQLKTITTELNKALGGHEEAARSVLTQIGDFMTQLDENRADIVHAIESVNRLAKSVRQRQGAIDAALDELPSALTSLDQQRGDLIRMLHSLDRLSGIGIHVIRASKAGTIETLRQLQPILFEIGNSGQAFVKAFNVFLTYPFVDEVVGRDPQVARNLHMGDYTNLSVRLNLTLGQLLNPVTEECTQLNQIPDTGPLPDLDTLCQHALAVVQRCLDNPTVQNCRGLPGAVIDEACQATNLPRLCGGGGGGLPTSLPSPGLPGGGGSGGSSGDGGVLDGLPGLNRTGAGLPVRGDRVVPTLAGLTRTYDRALVTLLVPGVVTP